MLTTVSSFELSYPSRNNSANIQIDQIKIKEKASLRKTPKSGLNIRVPEITNFKGAVLFQSLKQSIPLNVDRLLLQ